MSALFKVISVHIRDSTDLTSIHKLISTIRPHWDLLSLRFKVFNEGISNTLFGVHIEEKLSPATCVLVRIFGPCTELYIDRQSEAYFLWLLHKEKFAGEVYAQFENGICYGYIPGLVSNYDILTSPKYYRMIAEKAAEMHSLSLRGTAERYLVDSHLPMNEEACLFVRLQNYIHLLPDITSRPSNSRQGFFSPDAINTYPAEYPSKAELSRELKFLKNLLADVKSPVRFCHNDLLMGNILIDPHQDSVSFIDFEYCGYNHVAYEIANHFCEYAGTTDLDFSRYPERKLQRRWVQEYIEASIRFTQPAHANGDAWSLHLQVDSLLEEVEKFTLASHLLWSIWSMIQSFRSSINFDFKSYALARLKEYYRKKDSLISP